MLVVTIKAKMASNFGIDSEVKTALAIPRSYSSTSPNALNSGKKVAGKTWCMRS